MYNNLGSVNSALNLHVGLLLTVILSGRSRLEKCLLMFHFGLYLIAMCEAVSWWVEGKKSRVHNLSVKGLIYYVLQLLPSYLVIF